MRKNYTRAEVEFEALAVEDVITLSVNPFDPAKEDQKDIDEL